MLLGQKRKLSNSNNNEDDKDEDNEININAIEDVNTSFSSIGPNGTIPFINYFMLNLTLDDSELNASIDKYSITSFKQPQEKIRKENMSFYYISPKFDNLCLQEISLSSLLSLFPNRNINIVLDLDETMIHSKPIEFFSPMNKHTINNDSISIQFIANNGFNYTSNVNFRPYFKDFIASVKQYATFYIFTLSNCTYADQVIEGMRNATGMEVKTDHILSMKPTDDPIHFQKSLNYYKDININNTLILDDAAAKWDVANMQNLILSKRYMCFNDEESIGYHYIVEDKPPQGNNVFYEDADCKVGVCIENDTAKRFQLKYLMVFIENAYKLSLIRNEEVVHCYQRLRKRILSKKLINFTYYGISTEVGFLKEIVKYLGGDITLEKGASTHFVISPGYISQFKSNCLPEIKNKKYYCVNVNWLFQSYFCLTKLNEQLEEFKVII